MSKQLGLRILLCLTCSSLAGAGLVQHWALDGDTTNEIPGGVGGIALGGVTYADGILEQAAVFNGTNSAIRLNGPLLGASQTITLTYWVYPFTYDAGSHYDSIISTNSWVNGSIHSILRPTGEVATVVNLPGCPQWQTDSTIPLNAWTHMGWTFDTTGDGLVCKYYINGVLDVTKTSDDFGGVAIPFGAATIGAWFDWLNTYVRFLSGKVDDVRIYNEVLEESAIYQLYSEGAFPDDFVLITESNDSTMAAEGGLTDSYQVVLVQSPTAGAIVNVKAVPADSQIKLNNASAGMAIDLVFTDQNWSTPQTVTVAALDDTLADPDHVSVISHFLTCAQDPRFDDLQVAPLDVAIIENDTCGLTLVPAMDFNEDCRVDLADFVAWGNEWLDCTQPNMPGSSNRLLDWWREARFGMFLHWGPVSLTGYEIGWSRSTNTPVEVYDALYQDFNPTLYDAAEWVTMARAAGVKYIVFTSKHHDGFCMWDSAYTDYDIMNTPIARDLLAELADACKQQGMPFNLYYSILDWYQPDYNTLNTMGGPGYTVPDPDLDRYVQYMKNQLAELNTKYGPLGVYWFDGGWESVWNLQRGLDLDIYCRGQQPSVIINNRTIWTGDFYTPEQVVGAFDMNRPWETCMTLGTQWAWKPNDNIKSLKTCIQTLVQAVGGDGNFLFNIGPMPDGRIEQRQADRFREMGHWLKHYGETVYGTRGGPYKPGAWGASTRKDNLIYIHILDSTQLPLVLPPLNKTILSSWVLTGGEASVVQTPTNVLIDVPDYYRRVIDTIVVLELDGPAIEIAPIDT